MIQKTDLPISYDDVRLAWQHVGPHLEPTPLRRYPLLDELVGGTVFVKHENLQPTHAFKVRNAFSALGQLAPDARRRGVIAATRGNHGLGLCYAGQALGIGVTICVPHGNNPEKNAAIRSFGARLFEQGRDYDETLEFTKALAAREGLHTVHSTNDRTVIAGAGTLTDEILAQLTASALGGDELARVRSGRAAPGPMEKPLPLDLLVVAVGGGSQAVGALTILAERMPELEVWGVQAANAPAQQKSWEAGRNVTTESADTIADGLATRTSYELTRPALRAGLSRFLLVSEAELRNAIRVFLDTARTLSEPAGAAGLAGLLQCQGELRGRRVAVILSGANIDRATLGAALAE
ncbi:MAG: pyridoxal-phosphate dependent enzyme [Candidatus Eisenbacteria bacterium]